MALEKKKSMFFPLRTLEITWVSPAEKWKWKFFLGLLLGSRCPLRCLPTEACVCVHALCKCVPCSVDKPVDRTLIQPGVEDNLLDVPVIVSKKGSTESRATSWIHCSVEKVYFGNPYSGREEGEGQQLGF